ncbi:MAG: hypothetical protein IPG45_22730 [Deltaproteobacteria bacterium]|nr:hypothetical protein [Deltaproteobacteria bacterium]
MRFWIGHLFLLLLCVVGPFGAGFYFDTLSQVERAQLAGSTGARLAAQNFETTMTLEAHRSVSNAVSVAQRVSDELLVAELTKPGAKGKQAFAALAKILQESAPAGGVAWLLDGEGRVIAENGQAELTEPTRSLIGHPLFIETQYGYALDSTLMVGDRLLLVAVAPLSEKGTADGAVLIGRALDQAWIESLAKPLEVDLSILAGETVVVSTLAPEIAQEISLSAPKTGEPNHGGSLEKPLTHVGVVPGLPLLIDKQATGLAYASLANGLPGAGGLHCVVSAPSTEGLGQIAARQELIISMFAASLLLALLIGMVNHRTFVTPIGRMEKHLSEIQLGSGHGELLESAVSSPFRRLVRLTNMLVQKMPARSFSTMSGASMDGPSPISELPGMSARRSDSLVGQIEARGPADAYSSVPSQSVNLSAFPSIPATPASVNGTNPGLGDDLFGSDDDVPSLPIAPSPRRQDQDPSIAEAIASLEAGLKDARPSAPTPPPPPPPPSGKKQIRSASEIRGGRPMMAPPAPAAETFSPFVPSQSQFLREGDNLFGQSQDTPLPSMGQASAVRGGGSLDGGYSGLGASVGLGSAQPANLEDGGFNPEATVVAPVAEDLLAKSARDDFSDFSNDKSPDSTMVHSVPADLLAASAGEGPLPGQAGADLDAGDRAHFKEVYEKFIEMRRRCGEGTSDLGFEKFLTKLIRNREQLVKKYQCRTVRFQVYEKDGKAALKATPVRAK